jgi:hypothetical protein
LSKFGVEIKIEVDNAKNKAAPITPTSAAPPDEYSRDKIDGRGDCTIIIPPDAIG